MTDSWVLVDGYSVLHAWSRLASRMARQQSLQQRRDALVGLLRQYGDHTGRKVTAMFDGYGATHKPDVAEASPGAQVLFSGRGRTADDLIERLVAQADNRQQILVVTSDNLERQAVESPGAHSQSAEAFEEEAETALTELGRLVRAHGRRPKMEIIRTQFGR